MIDRNIVQAFSVALALISMIAWLRLARKYPRQGLYLLVPALYSLLVLVFYVGVVLREAGFFAGVSFGDLSAWLRLVEIMVLAGMGLLLTLDRIAVHRGD